MHLTEIELQFVELPDVPSYVELDLNNGYLLSMWDCSCRIAKWNNGQRRFEDQGGLLNPLAIRSWAVLPKPVDYPTWGKNIIDAAVAKDGTYEQAGWLEPVYVSAAAT